MKKALAISCLVLQAVLEHQLLSQAIKVKTETKSAFQVRMEEGGTVRSVLEDYKTDFAQGIFNSLLQKDAELSHLLYSDLVALEQRIVMDFSDVVSQQSIGTSWQGREINVLTLDARQLMASKKIQVSGAMPTENKKEDAAKVQVGDDSPAQGKDDDATNAQVQEDSTTATTKTSSDAS